MGRPQPRIGVVTYPGSQDDRDALWALAALDAEAVPVWHDEPELPAEVVRATRAKYVEAFERLTTIPFQAYLDNPSVVLG